MLNTKLVSWSLGLFAAIAFVVCVIWSLVTPESLHMKNLLEQLLPAFRWLNWWGFLLGQAFVVATAIRTFPSSQTDAVAAQAPCIASRPDFQPRRLAPFTP